MPINIQTLAKSIMRFSRHEANKNVLFRDNTLSILYSKFSSSFEMQCRAKKSLLQNCLAEGYAFYFPSFFSFERVGKSLNIIERFEVIACAWLRDWAIWFGAIKVGKRSSFDMPRNYNFWAPKWWHTQWSLDLRTKKCFCCSFHTNFLSSSRKGQPCREILRVNSKFECIFFQPPPFSHLYQEVHHQLNLTA